MTLYDLLVFLCVFVTRLFVVQVGKLVRAYAVRYLQIIVLYHEVAPVQVKVWLVELLDLVHFFVYHLYDKKHLFFVAREVHLSASFEHGLAILFLKHLELLIVYIELVVVDANSREEGQLQVQPRSKQKTDGHEVSSLRSSLKNESQPHSECKNSVNNNHTGGKRNVPFLEVLLEAALAELVVNGFREHVYSNER